MSTRQKNAFLNAVIAKKEIIRQQTLRNSSRRSKEQPIVTVKGNIIPVKLPTIVKKTPPRSKMFDMKYFKNACFSF
jgi:hypothetical protein